ncbi:hypothetical protein QYE76_069647 [Lolium multiflorum]|uniref:F-box domain-containing protein n=1 Tax=Lolium multiflorum TaxID=4521 RepID=A0AAD8WF45_LOLMU|nr:hypothetical protein QYE76_069647 [Lolium multiflorum]
MEACSLPRDILIDIFATFEIPDLVRAGSVCSSWRSVYTTLRKLGKYKQSQTPCLLYTSESAGENVAGLYSLAESKSYTLPLPDPPIRSRYVIGSSHGWIITADERSELHLLNPITGDQIALPSVTTIEQVKPVHNNDGVLHKYEFSWYTAEEVYDSPSIYDLRELRDRLFHKAFLSSDPSNGDYYVVLIYTPYHQLSFARAGDDKWTWLPPHIHCSDCIVKDYMFYVSTSDGAIHEFDTSGPTVTQKLVIDEVKDDIFEEIHIVQAPCGDMLQVWTVLDSAEFDGDLSEPEFDAEYYARCSVIIKVYKVDLAAKKLAAISSLG